jgi:hypothetical protein
VLRLNETLNFIRDKILEQNKISYTEIIHHSDVPQHDTVSQVVTEYTDLFRKYSNNVTVHIPLGLEGCWMALLGAER